jgi:3-deoxy-D-manno-octulosonic-acid transferase
MKTFGFVTHLRTYVLFNNELERVFWSLIGIISSMTILEQIYKMLMGPTSLVVSPLFLLSPRGRMRFFERFGSWGSLPGELSWFHGASLGEVKGLLPLVRTLTPHLEGTLLTATSAPALHLAGDDVSLTRLLPFDSRWWLSRALARSRIRLFVSTETELWPTLTYMLSQNGVPLYHVNARISEYTFPRYYKVRRLIVDVLHRYKRIYVSDEASMDRFSGLGVASDILTLVGNTKYDAVPKFSYPFSREPMRRKWWKATDVSDNDIVVTLGSLRPGEEEHWFPAIVKLLRRYPRLKVVVAPRHNEKIDYFKDALTRFGLSYALLSQVLTSSNSVSSPILLLDISGYLEDAYALSSLAFIGATLVDIGGHNPLEACAYGTPVVVGPHHSVIKEVVQRLVSARVCTVVTGCNDIERLVELAHRNDGSEVEVRQRTRDTWLSFQGVAKKIVDDIVSIERL